MYLSINGECETQKIIEKSRFITTSKHISDEEEARDFIAGIRRKFPDATHNCYAYIADSLGNFPRFSDDGEPSGTAGMPILEVIKNKKLFQTAVVVTRYFGGIKLGAGGLVRAYSGSASENLDIAEKVLYEICSQSEYFVDYSSVDTVMRYCAEKCASLIDTLYKDEVVFTIAVKKADEEKFNAGLVNRLNGKLKIQKMKEYFFPFKI